jgi:hypothetical protein
MDVAGTSADNGKEVHQYDCGDAPDQKWLLSELTSPDAATAGNTQPTTSAFMCKYKHKEDTKGGKKGEANFLDALGNKKSCDAQADWKTSCKDGNGKTDEVGCASAMPQPPTPGKCQYKHKKDTAGGKKDQVTGLDAFGKQKSCDRNGDWKTSCKDSNGDTDEVACQ